MEVLNLFSAAIVTLVLGIVLIIKPLILETICLVAGVLLCLIGLCSLVILLVKKEKDKNQYISTVLLWFVPGILVILIPKLLKILVPILFGLWILSSAVPGLFRHISYRKTYSGWWMGAVLCVICIALGVFVITRPGEVTEATVRLIGICIVIHSVLRMVAIHIGSKYYSSEPIETTLGE